MTYTVEIFSEIPEELHNAAQDYLDTNKAWDQDRLMQAALSLFLMQNGRCDSAVSRAYLDSLFSEAAA